MFATAALWSLAHSVTRASENLPQDPRGREALFQLGFPPQASLDRSKWKPILTAHSPTVGRTPNLWDRDHLPLDAQGQCQAEFIHVPAKRGEMYNLLLLVPVRTYMRSHEFGAGFCERDAYLVKNRKTQNKKDFFFFYCQGYCYLPSFPSLLISLPHYAYRWHLKIETMASIYKIKII